MGLEVLNLNPVSLMFGENGRATHLGAATAADIDSAPDGLRLRPRWFDREGDGSAFAWDRPEGRRRHDVCRILSHQW